MSKAAQLKELLYRDEISIAAGCFDGISARLVQAVGFDVALLSGYGVSASVLGAPDYGMLTMTEMATQTRNVANILDIPLIADADTGYGNPLNVRRTVMEYEMAGAAAIQLEDQVFPKRCGHMDGKAVIPMLEHCKKIEMAVETRKEMLILARTDARATHGIDEAIRRVNEYAKAGADFVLIDAPDASELRRITENVKVPVMVNMVEGGKTTILTKQELQDMGFALICYPVAALFAAAKNMREVLTHLKEKGTTQDIPEKLETFASFTALVGLPQLQQLEKKYAV